MIHHLLKDVEVECGSGWNHILLQMCEGIESCIKQIDPYGEIKFLHVKEKWGSLRVAFDLRPIQKSHMLYNNIANIVSAAERFSRITCELCGMTGAKLGDHNGRYKTLCDDCSKRTI